MDSLLAKLGFTNGIDDNSIYELIEAYINGDEDYSEELRQFPIGTWDVSKVTDLSSAFNGMFSPYTSFNEPLDAWDVSNVTKMTSMFADCANFNQPLNSWKVSSLEEMNSMFYGCTSFNQSLDSWDVSNVSDMGGLFTNCKSFNQPLNSWNVINVNNAAAIFSGCTNFNQSLDSWNVGNVSDMTSMFSECTNFNQPLNSWDVSSVEEMASMFKDCKMFNQPLDSWDVTSVVDMSEMFYGCTSFNQPLDSWDASNVQSTLSMFDGTDFNFRINIIQHLVDIDIPKDPNNSSKHLFVNVGVHGSCSVQTTCDDTDNEIFIVPNFINFKLTRVVPIGALNWSYRDKGFHCNRYVATRNANGEFIDHYIPTYCDKYDSYKQPYDDNDVLYHVNTLDDYIYDADTDPYSMYNDSTKIDTNKIKKYNQKKYLYEQSKIPGMINREFINPKKLFNKSLYIGDERLNQIVFIVDRADPILLRLTEPNNTIYSKYYQESQTRQKFKFEELLLFIYSLGFRNVEVRDNSCSCLKDRDTGRSLNPYDPKVQTIIDRHKDHGGTRRKRKQTKKRCKKYKRHSKKRCKRKSRKYKK
jgi:surface protein